MANDKNAGELREIRLGDMVPGANPRQDFGDITGLSQAILATGGQPINPVVVSEDGSGWYHIVDGERRWRALKSIHGEDGLTVAKVYQSYTEAAEAVAMVATDAKKELTEQERARGFQTMMMLDVDVVTMARATRRKPAEIKGAMRVASLAGEQATLDQMIAAGEFEDEAQQRKVLDAKPESWRAVAETVRRDILKEEDARVTRDHLVAAGVRTEEEADLHEYRNMGYVGPKDDVAVLVGGAPDDFLAVRCQWDRGKYMLYRVAEVVREATETDEERAERERKEEHAQRVDSAWRDLFAALLDFALKRVNLPELRSALGLVRATYLYDGALEYQIRGIVSVASRHADADDPDEELVEAVRAITCMPLSHFELLRALSKAPYYGHERWHEDTRLIIDAARADGYQPSEADLWLYEEAGKGEAE